MENQGFRLTPDRSPGMRGRLKCRFAFASGSDCFPGASPGQYADFRWLASPLQIQYHPADTRGTLT